MNKYYIGYPLPEDLTRIIAGVQHNIGGAPTLMELDQLHITAMYIGEKARPDAESLFAGLGRRTLPILSSLDTYKRFGEALVITLQPNDAMQEVHSELHKLAGTKPHKNGYNPHITVAKGSKAFIKIACPEKSFAVSYIALFEKQEGSDYHMHRMTRFQ